MKKYFLYLKYLIRHKWFVFIACHYCGVSLWRAIIHDWSKFLPCEWFAYVNFFYANYPEWSAISPGLKYAGYPYELTSDYWQKRFDRAWLHHQKVNKHHWQYWLLTYDEGKTQPLEIPEKYVREMVADWWGAGRAITGRWNAPEWYNENRDKMDIWNSSRNQVVDILAESQAAMLRKYRVESGMFQKPNQA